MKGRPAIPTAATKGVLCASSLDPCFKDWLIVVARVKERPRAVALCWAGFPKCLLVLAAWYGRKSLNQIGRTTDFFSLFSFHSLCLTDASVLWIIHLSYQTDDWDTDLLSYVNQPLNSSLYEELTRKFKTQNFKRKKGKFLCFLHRLSLRRHNSRSFQLC